MTEHGWPGDPLAKGDPTRIGPYTLLGRLGAGGMGRIYLGRSPFGRLVAIKTIRSELGGDPGFRARFAQEVAAARRVSGVFTAAVVNADPEAPVPWLATAYVAAPSMENLVRECGPLPPRSIRWLAAGIAEALESVHAAGLVHRDLKPSNVLVAGDGPKVIDFGISRAADFGSLTMTGVAVGTPAYMSPEQAQGVREITPASDMFSLGATVVYAATGHSPYPDRKPAEALLRLVTGEPNLEGLPPELRELVEWLMQRAPERRPSPTELLTRLAPMLDAEGDSSDAESRLPASAAAVVDRFEKAYRPAGQRTPPAPEPERPAPEAEPAGGLRDDDWGRLPAQAGRERHAAEAPPDPGAPDRRPAREPAGAAADPAGAAARPKINYEKPPRRAPAGGPAAAGPGAAASQPPRPAGPPPATPPAPATRPPGASRPGHAPAASRPGTAAGPGGAAHRHPGPSRPPAGGADHAAPVWRFQASGEVLTPCVRAGTGRTARVHVHSGDNALHTLHLTTREWRFDSSGWSHPPAVEGENMYLASQDSHVYALELTSRQWKWSFPANGDVVAAPVVADGTVYFASSDNALYAVDAATGRARWRFPTGGWATTPAVADGTVYFGSSDRCVYAVDAASGWCRWRYATNGWVSAPTVSGQVVHVGSTDHYLYLLDAATGSMRGWFQASGPVAQPAAANGVTYFGSGDHCLYAVDTASAQCLWRFPTEGWVTSPVVDRGMVYAGSSDGSVHAVAADGAPRWRFTTGGRVTSPVVADGLLFVGSADRHLYVLDADSGRGPA